MLKPTSYLKLVILTAFLQALAASPVFSGAPLKINFQGRLDENSQPAEGSKTLVFKIYDAVSGGTLVWTSAAQALTLSNGIFSAILETGTPAALSTATFAGARYVEMSVDGVTLSPRQEMVSAPYALVAQALAADAELPASSIADGSVTDAKVSLTTAAITSGRFGDDRVLITTGAFAALNGADQLVKLESNGKLPVLDGSALTNVPAASYSGSVAAGQVADGTLGANVIASSVAVNKVYSGAIQAGAVTDAKVLLTTAAITSGRFGDDRVLITTGAFSGGFNGGSQLVQLQAGGALPGLNGSALTGISVSAADITGTITDASVALTTSAVVYGKFSDDRVWITTGAVYLGLFGDDRVQVSTGAVNSGRFGDDRVQISTAVISGLGALAIEEAEGDPLFSVSVSSLIVAADITNWNTAHGLITGTDYATQAEMDAALLAYASLSSTQAFTGSNTFSGSSNFASTAAFTAQHATVPGVAVSSGLVVAGGFVGVGTVSPNSMLNVAGAVSLAIKTITNADSPYSPTAADSTILVDGTTGASDPTTINLPDASLVPGRIYTFKRIDPEGIGYTYSVDITPFAGQGIEEGPGYSLNIVQWQTVTLQSYGTGWIILHSN